jgi:CBS domain-containing protein
MKVREMMTSDVATCLPDTDLATVVKLMWERDCGFVPVVDRAGALLGVVTDRDICIASATRHLLPQYMPASAVMTHPVHACLPDDEATTMLEAMKRFRVRRLPVIDGGGTLRGVVSMNDVVLAVERGSELDPRAVVSTLAAICDHRTSTSRLDAVGG